MAKLENHNIKIVETGIDKAEHTNGHLRNILFKDGTRSAISAIYARSDFRQHCTIPQDLGCDLTDEGYIKINNSQMTSVEGIFACGDNVSRMRTVANAVAMGTTVGIMVNKEIVFEKL